LDIFWNATGVCMCENCTLVQYHNKSGSWVVWNSDEPSAISISEGENLYVRLNITMDTIHPDDINYTCDITYHKVV
jgi:hypothetical protein